MNFIRLSFSILLLLVVAACGGAGGDNVLNKDPDNTAAEAVERVVGVWDLPGDWNGTTGDEAYLVIGQPNASGIAVATIYDLDDAVAGAERNCFLIDGEGEIMKSLTDDLFLDVPAFNSAVAALKANDDLEISVFAAGSGSGDAPERVLVATRLGLTVNELTPC